MCGTEPRVVHLPDVPVSQLAMSKESPLYAELPKLFALHAECSQRAHEGTCTDSSDLDSAYESCGVGKHTEGLGFGVECCDRLGSFQPVQLADSMTSSVSPRSACSTPGGTDNSMGIQLHALVFGVRQLQRHSADATGNRKDRCHQPTGQQPFSGTRGRRHSGPHRNHTMSDLRRGSADTSNSWSASSYAKGGYVLHSIAAMGMRDTPSSNGAGMRSISKAKQVLAEAVNSIPDAHGLGQFPMSTCDTGVLSPLLSIIRHNGAVSRRSSFSDTASNCSGNTACGSSRCLQPSGSLLSSSRCCSGRLSRLSSCGDAESCGDCIPEDVPAELCNAVQYEAYLQHKQRQQAAQLQKVIDCIDTVKYLAMDESNRLALLDLGVVDLLLSKIRPTTSPSQALNVSCLAALATICKHDVMKQQLWCNPDSSAILQLLSSRHNTPAVKAAHQAVQQLGWSVDIVGGCSSCSTTGSIFDSVTSHISSADSSSSCSGANVLLEPAIIPALAAALHPATDVPVLMSALKLLGRAAGSDEVDLQALSCASRKHTPSPSQHGCLTHQQQVTWNRVLFALMPLLIPSQRRQGRFVLGAALELLVVLTEHHPELQNSICAAGCFPPLLVQMLEGASEQSLQAACIITSLADSTAAQERLAQEPALAVLLRVLQSSERSVDVRLAAVHVLRRLASCVPDSVQLMKALDAAPIVMALMQQVPDFDVRRAAGGFLQLLGASLSSRGRHGRSLDYGSRDCSRQAVQHQHTRSHRHRQHPRFQSSVAKQQSVQQWNYEQAEFLGAVAAGCCTSRAVY